MKVLVALLSLSLALQAHSQCHDISSEDQRAVTIGQHVCFRCPLQGSNIMWTYQDTPSLIAGAQRAANGTLLITGVTTTHLNPRFFRCQADGGQQTDRYRLVEAAIRPPLVFDKTINESASDSVFCIADGAPTPHIVQWMYEGAVVSNNSLLKLSNVQRTQAGVYTCVTTNTVGTASGNVILTVQYAPSNTLMTTAFVPHQLNHTLTCSFDGVPRPTVTWRVNGTTILSGTDNFVISESGEVGSDLTILGTRLDNTGEYECEVSNLLGGDSKTASLTVQVPPYAPTGLSVSAITTTSFLLTWTNPFNGNSPLTAATITLNSTGESTSFQADTLTSHQFQGLVPNRQYEIEVVVSNTIGSSPPGSMSALTLPLAPAQPTPFTVTALSSTELQLSWMPPADDPRITPITSWVVQYQTEGSPTITRTISNPTARQFSLPGLMKGTLYVVSIAGVNSAGVGNYTEEVSRRTIIDSPSAPRNLSDFVLNPQSAIVRWEPSADNGGSPLFNYRVELQVAGGSYITIATVSHPTLMYELTLQPETNYMVRVAARNLNNSLYGPNSIELSFTTPEINFPPASGVPPLRSDLTDTSVTISFAPLVGVVTVYVVEYRLDRLTWASATREIINMTTPNANGRISTTITGLEPNSPYQFRFFSRNDVRDSAPSPALSVMTGQQITIKAPAASEMTVGSVIVLECVFSSGNAATSVTWLLDGQPVTEANVQVDGNRLTITNAMESNDGLYSCQHNGTGDTVVVTETQVDIMPAPTSSTGLSLSTLLIIVVTCVAGGGVILLIVVIVIIALCCYCKKSTTGQGHYTITNGNSKTKSKSKSTWIEAPGESDPGSMYLSSSHYPTVRAQDSGQAMIEGTPFDYQSFEATDHQPYSSSTFNTMELNRAQNMEPRYVTPPPPVMEGPNEMHMMSLQRPPKREEMPEPPQEMHADTFHPMFGREDMV